MTDIVVAAMQYGICQVGSNAGGAADQPPLDDDRRFDNTCIASIAQCLYFLVRCLVLLVHDHHMRMATFAGPASARCCKLLT